MRKELCDALVARASDENMVFLTGDLGFMALEPLREAMGSRFINAGVAEQNMVGVAAALAAQGFEVWVYSIAPFCYARPFEQIRNDITFHHLPVNLIGNGGGYGYGVMGPTHHAIEDYGVLLTLPNLDVIVPVFEQDVAPAIARAAASPRAVYVRLGRDEAPAGYAPPGYAPIRQLTFGDGPAVVSIGPLAGLYIDAFEKLPAHRRPNLWAVAELPLAWETLPPELIAQIASTSALCVAEEHVRHGGLAAELLVILAERGIPVRSFAHLHALAHHYERYGSQTYLRKQSHLDVESMLAALERMKAPAIGSP
jgi:transketolase